MESKFNFTLGVINSVAQLKFLILKFVILATAGIHRKANSKAKTGHLTSGEMDSRCSGNDKRERVLVRHFL